MQHAASGCVDAAWQGRGVAAPRSSSGDRPWRGESAVGAEDALPGEETDATVEALPALGVGAGQLHLSVLRNAASGAYDRSRSSALGGWPAHLGQPGRMLPEVQPEEGRQDPDAGLY